MTRQPERAELSTIAMHEAGHAVMRWLRGMPATEVTATEDGGFCAGTGQEVRDEDHLLVTLAGFAAESWCLGGALDLPNCHADDFDRARELLARSAWMRLRMRPGDERPIEEPVDDALQRYWQLACELLYPHVDVTEQIAERLEHTGRVSARSIAAILASYNRRQQHQEPNL